ncbi:2,3-diaminopropionate biosynthesis protein SbnA [Paenibacillus arenosi]|uniref:2,3-diaminopropionate biosynthesis protein SbnA n=1 Tax=Paenibacillus arenosi TaxID=2774142 RepID=A0ABR9AS37_9BACL|nr:2,3-diaminopropionate biosynthesis protein SbnA [Paenibacillus arenosi]MBD8496920.1 2,3-diaminopropionate biosynthesis protein SbnA [Paenibacillus arenosi]
MIYNSILNRVGNTPIVHINVPELVQTKVYAKMEMFNPMGSVKDRAASYLLHKLLETGEINKDTVIIESSSGNFGLALASFCREHGLKFYCVIDANIMPDNEILINHLSDKVFKITEPDASGGYLLNRIEKVKELKRNIPNSYWVNQYENPLNAEAYYQTLGAEINDSFDKLDYLFMGVSSGGTITGVSNKVKDKFPNAKVIAVDIVGSVIFGNPPGKRKIPGIGSSKYPKILDQAKIDEVVMVEETTSIEMCHRLFTDYRILAGGSSGSALAAILSYFYKNPPGKHTTVITVFPDRGDRYASTIYNPEWCATFPRKEVMNAISQ